MMREWWMVVRRGRRGKRGELPVTGAGDGVLLVIMDGGIDGVRKGKATARIMYIQSMGRPRDCTKNSAHKVVTSTSTPFL